MHAICIANQAGKVLVAYKYGQPNYSLFDYWYYIVAVFIIDDARWGTQLLEIQLFFESKKNSWRVWGSKLGHLVYEPAFSPFGHLANPFHCRVVLLKGSKTSYITVLAFFEIHGLPGAEKHSFPSLFPISSIWRDEQINFRIFVRKMHSAGFRWKSAFHYFEMSINMEQSHRKISVRE